MVTKYEFEWHWMLIVHFYPFCFLAVIKHHNGQKWIIGIASSKKINESNKTVVPKFVWSMLSIFFSPILPFLECHYLLPNLSNKGSWPYFVLALFSSYLFCPCLLYTIFSKCDYLLSSGCNKGFQSLVYAAISS